MLDVGAERSEAEIQSSSPHTHTERGVLANGNSPVHIITPKCMKMSICHKVLHVGINTGNNDLQIYSQSKHHLRAQLWSSGVFKRPVTTRTFHSWVWEITHGRHRSASPFKAAETQALLSDREFRQRGFLFCFVLFCVYVFHLIFGSE